MGLCKILLRSRVISLRVIVLRSGVISLQVVVLRSGVISLQVVVLRSGVISLRMILLNQMKELALINKEYDVDIFEVYVIPDSEDDQDEPGAAESVLLDSEDGVHQHGPVLLVSSDSEEEIDGGRSYVYVISDSEDDEDELDVIGLVPPDSEGEVDVISISSSSEYGVEDQVPPVPPVAPHAPPGLFPPAPVFLGLRVGMLMLRTRISAGTLQESHSSLAGLGSASSSRYFAHSIN
ncbi:uncharacterized protein V6R79_008699 [Siganus canaliculatus]